MSLVKLEIRIVLTSLLPPFLGIVPNLYFPIFFLKNTINSLSVYLSLFHGVMVKV